MISLTSYIPDYAGDIARYADPPNEELQQVVWLCIIVGFVLFLMVIKKTNPELHEKITNTMWGIVGIVLLAFIYNKLKNKE
jgi:vacuolar-type H+-ATPase subunit I/STV1